MSMVCILRSFLIVGTGFLGLTAVPGGALLMLGVYSPPVEMLRGSLFSTFGIPGLALAVVVGGSALAAMVLVIRRHRLSYVGAGVAGIAIMSFEFIQVVSIGSPVGPSRVMQVLYFAVGLALVATSLAAQLISIRPLSEPTAPRTRSE
jgi:hypothetical protein